MWIVKFCVFLQEVNLSDVPLSAAGRGNLKEGVINCCFL